MTRFSIFLSLALSMTLLSSCRSVMSDKVLAPEKMKGVSAYRALPGLYPIVDKKSYDNVYASDLNLLRQVYPEYATNFFYEDARILLKNHVDLNLCTAGGSRSIGYLKCKLLDAKQSEKCFGYVLPAAFTGCALWLFGWPMEAMKASQDVEFQILDCKEEVIKTYHIQEQAKKTIGLYYNSYYTRDQSRFMYACSFKNVLKEAQKQISADAVEIRNKLNQAAKELAKEQALALKATQAPDPTYNKAIREMEQGKADEALALFDRTVKSSPYNAYAYFYRGLIRYNSKQYAQAYADMKRAAQLMPRMADAYFYKASVLFQQRKTTDADVAIRQAVALQPRNESYRILSGVILEATGYREQAKNEYAQALEINPDHVEINDWIAKIDEQISNQKTLENEAQIMRLQRQAEALQAAGQILSNTANALSSGSVAPTSVTAPATTGKQSSQTVKKKKTCSLCHGTGKNPAKERPAMYDSTTEDYSGSPCEICGSRTNHWHKDCPSCRGRGYN